MLSAGPDHLVTPNVFRTNIIKNAAVSIVGIGNKEKLWPEMVMTNPSVAS